MYKFRSRPLLGAIALLFIASAVLAFQLLTSNGVTNKDRKQVKASREIHHVGTPPATPVQILVSFAYVGNRTVYQYRVANGSAFPISMVSIGYDDQTTASELKVPPRGNWTAGTDPESTYVVPAGWQYEFVSEEGEPLGQVEWSVVDSAQVILGGHDKIFSVIPVSTNPIPSYVGSHWTVYTTSTEERVYTGTLQPDPVTGVRGDTSLDHDTGLKVSPVPSGGPATMRFNLPRGTSYEVTVYDVQGRVVRKVARGRSQGTTTTISWDGRDATGVGVASGVYFARVKTPNEQRFARVVITK